MDINYLLFLQDFRNSINDALTPLMEWASMFAVTYLILFAVFYYWNFDKKKGLHTLLSYYLCMVFTPLIKLTACVYRPWIRDGRILPAGDAIRTATGYSFPSGHTSTAAPLSFGMAYNLWETKKARAFAAIFVAFALLTAFSRNYLGVHTPQDVCTGLAISVASIFLAKKLIGYISENPEKENYFLLGGFVFCCLAILYITIKPYPMDYTEDGKLLVDPQKMMNDGYGDIGKMMGFVIARFVEKTWIKFEPMKSKKGALICLAGLVPMVLLKSHLNPVIVAAFGPHWGKLLFSVVYVFYYIALFPLVIKLLGAKMNRKNRM